MQVDGGWTRIKNALRGRKPDQIRAGVGKGLFIGSSQASADYTQGTNELPVQEAVAGNLVPGDIFVDVGANVGFFSLLAARAVGPDGHVYAVEPVPENIEAIHANARRNHFTQITVVPVAASDSVGTALLTLTEHPGGAALASAERPPDTIGEIEVETATLDSLVDEGRILPPSLVKIDVEGAEEPVLEGMTATMRTHAPTLIVEVDGPDDETMQAKRAGVVEQLARAGYGAEDLPAAYPPSMPWRVAHMVCRPRSDR
jgi:FkbM family methyltransferase